MEKKYKRWAISTVSLFALFLICVAGLVIWIDPFFHFHGPLEYINYNLFDERYQNDGIAKHFEYDALITGTSMTENFKTSELDSLFGTKSVKTSFAGGSYLETDEIVRTALENNPNLKMVVRSLDLNNIFWDKDDRGYNPNSYPTYLYDKNPLNDTKYIFNKTVVLNALQDIIGVDENGPFDMSFDRYSNWMDECPVGKDIVNASYARNSVVPAESQKKITDEELSKITASITQNYIETALANPTVDFYVFVPPYSIYYLDYYYLLGDLERLLQAHRCALELLAPIDNIHLFSFYDKLDTIKDINHYRDIGHFDETVNSKILVWMHDGVGELSKENVSDYCDKLYDYYMNLDFDAVYAELTR